MRGRVRRGRPRRAGSRSIRRSPTIVLDAAHNPHGAEAHGRRARGLVRVRPADRRARRDGRQGPRGRAGRVRAAPRPRRLHPELHRPRAAGRAAGRGGAARSSARTGSRSCPRLSDAIDQAAALAEAGEAFGDSLGSGAVLVTGSVVTVGEARTMLGGPRDERTDADPTALAPPRHVRRGAHPRGDHARADHAGDGRRSPTSTLGTALAIGLGLAVACLVLAGLLRARVGLRPRLGRPGRRDRPRLPGADDVLPRARSSRCCGARRTSSAARSSASGPRRTPPATRARTLSAAAQAGSSARRVRPAAPAGRAARRAR